MKRISSFLTKGAIIILLVLLSLALGKGIYFIKGGFSARRIHPLDHWIEPHFSKEAKSALKQSYRFLGRGRQCFAFVSEDGLYVLKLPRTDIFKTPFWVKALPVHAYRKRLEKNHKEREQFLTNSFQISLKELKEQTGVVAMHLGQSSLKDRLTLFDVSGMKQSFLMGKCSFILQYRHPILMNAFTNAMKEGKKDEARTILDALFAAIVERAGKGILNRDRSFLRNYGYDGEKAYQIDIGSFFTMNELPLKTVYEKSIRDSIDPVQEWLRDHHPEMLGYLDEKLEQSLRIQR